jgi:NAD(P)H dehydrogenase (quinone)
MRIAVTSGTGRVSGLVVRVLADDGRHDVVPLSSRTAPYDDPGALRTALDGTDTLVFVSSGGEAARVVVHHRNVLDAAIRCGVGHVVLLSGLDADVSSPFCYSFTSGDTERLLRASGLPSSIVRAGRFTEFFLGLIRQAGTSTGGTDGMVALPAAGNRVSLVARSDVARCLAALALREPTNGHHDVTGRSASPSRRSPRPTGSGMPTPRRPTSPARCRASARSRGGPTRTRACSNRSAKAAGQRPPTRSPN